MCGVFACISILFLKTLFQDDTPVVLTQDDNPVVLEDATSGVLSSWLVAATFSGSVAWNNWNGFCTTLQRTGSSCRGLCVCCSVCSMPRGTHTRGRQGRVPEELVQIRLVEPALAGAEEASRNEFCQVALHLSFRETKVHRQRGQQREALAVGTGIPRQPRPQELGAIGDQAAGEQGVGDEDAGVKNAAWDEDLTDLESRGRLGLVVR
jgi:hypothetical protein